MKHGKKPTVAQRKFIQSKRLNPANWYVTKDTPDRMELVHRHFDNRTRTIKKENERHGKEY